MNNYINLLLRYSIVALYPIFFRLVESGSFIIRQKSPCRPKIIFQIILEVCNILVCKSIINWFLIYHIYFLDFKWNDIKIVRNDIKNVKNSMYVFEIF